jgi:hypothetical protein
MLQAEYGVYTDGQSKIVRTQAYSLPSRLHEHIDLVSPTIYFGRAGQKLSNTIASNQGPLGYGEEAPPFPYETKGEIAYNGLCNSTNVTLACLARHYGYENYSKSRHHLQSTYPDFSDPIYSFEGGRKEQLWYHWVSQCMASICDHRLTFCVTQLSRRAYVSCPNRNVPLRPLRGRKLRLQTSTLQT